MYEFNGKKPLKPAEYAEKQLIEAVLKGELPQGSVLPGERVLAESLGVTRPTLRETLQRLSSEGWVTISHGRPTRVNDFFKEGGLSLLASLARYGETLSGEMIAHLLEMRKALLPGIARLAIDRNPSPLAGYLEKAEALEDDPRAYAEYDWSLQLLMGDLTENPLFRLMLNDFTPMYALLGKLYFTREKGRRSSFTYYRELASVLEKGGGAGEEVVRAAMAESARIWEKGISAGEAGE